MIKYKKIISLLVVISFSIIFNIANASIKIKELGKSKSWFAFTKMGKDKSCYIFSEPNKTTGNFDRKNRSKAGIFVVNTKGGVKYEVSVSAGFKFKHRTPIIFDVDGKKTIFFSNEETAWSESAKVDRLLVQSMRKGRKLKVTGTSSLGNKIVDIYSLSGFTKALRLIDKDCS